MELLDRPTDFPTRRVPLAAGVNAITALLAVGQGLRSGSELGILKKRASLAENRSALEEDGVKDAMEEHDDE